MRTDTFLYQKKKLLFWEDGDDSIKVKDYMLKNSLTGVVFCATLGFSGDSLTIDEPFEFVDEVNFISSNIKDISFIVNFPNAVSLNIENYDRTKLDFSCFDKLEELYLTWRKGVTNLFNKKCLRKLTIDKFKEKVLPNFADDMLLEEFQFNNSPVEDLSSLSNLKHIKVLDLGYLRCLQDSPWFKSLSGLEVLRIQSCKKMSDTIMGNIAELTNLKKLYFSKMGGIPTLVPIQNLTKLEEIRFIEDTKVLDKNLEPLKKLPNLKKHFFC
jgi:Leucine-rich repeat (LRR) protein